MRKILFFLIISGLIIGLTGTGTYSFYSDSNSSGTGIIVQSGLWEDETPAEDKSSLVFTLARINDAGQLVSIVMNSGDTSMLQERGWELHFVLSGNAPGPNNDKTENIIASGQIPLLAGAEAFTILWPDIANIDSIAAGIYKFKSYQRPGHPGNGVLWSEDIIIESLLIPEEGSSITIPTPASFTITASTTGGGSIAPEGNLIVTGGDSALYTLNPGEGYLIEGVLVDGISVFEDLVVIDGVYSYSFVNVAADHIISASFVKTGNSSDIVINTDQSTPDESTGG